MLTKTSRAIAVAAAAAIALTTMGLQPAAAGGRHDYGNGDVTAAAAVLGIVGSVATIIAAEQYRKRYRYDDYDGPVYGRPVYGGPVYGRPGYGWHRHDWRHHHRYDW